jgi:endonuclease YncB( thermonuclease family)
MHTPRPTNTPTPTGSEWVEARVVEVVDGDTIKVNIGGEIYTVCYLGVDAPEHVRSVSSVESPGRKASAANEALVGGQTVYLEKDVSETDRYGRLLRYVFLPDGQMVNGLLVERGYAVARSHPPDLRYQDLFEDMQEEAREKEIGLWAPTPTLPTMAPGDVQITYIFYDGLVEPEESDEYVAIRNKGGSPVNLAGWRLNKGGTGLDFWFPGFELQPGQECRVYTNEHHPESCGFSFGSGEALWNNRGDCGHLYDASGAEVSAYCY